MSKEDSMEEVEIDIDTLENTSPSRAPEIPLLIELRSQSWPSLLILFFVAIVVGLFLPDMIFGSTANKTLHCGFGKGDESTQAWCASNGFDEFFASWMHTTKAAKTVASITHVLNFVIAPAFSTALLFKTSSSYPLLQRFKMLGVICMAFIMQLGPVNIAKLSARRQRPCFYYDRESNTEAAHDLEDEFVSFYSGDTSSGVSWVIAGFTVAYYITPVTARKRIISKIWIIVGILICGMGSFGRIVADMHWMTDVLTGICAGSLLTITWISAFHMPKILLPGGDERYNVLYDNHDIQHSFMTSGTIEPSSGDDLKTESFEDSPYVTLSPGA